MTTTAGGNSGWRVVLGVQVSIVAGSGVAGCVGRKCAHKVYNPIGIVGRRVAGRRVARRNERGNWEAVSPLRTREQEKTGRGWHRRLVHSR